MAVLADRSTDRLWHLFEMPELEEPQARGTYPAVVLDIKDVFGVERPSFENPQVTEVVDLTAFLFGYRDRTGKPHRIDSKPMRISGNEKSALFAFLKTLLGESPQLGWDYLELKGRQVLITVEHVTSKRGDRIYAQIAAVSPLPEGMTMGAATERRQPAPTAAQPPRATAPPTRPTQRTYTPPTAPPTRPAARPATPPPVRNLAPPPPPAPPADDSEIPWPTGQTQETDPPGPDSNQPPVETAQTNDDMPF